MPREGPPAQPYRQRLKPDQITQLARQVRAERMHLGLTQQQCATNCGLSYNTLMELEAGDISPSPATVKKLAAGLGLDLSAFL